MPVGHLYVFFGNMSVQILCPFSNWAVYIFDVVLYDFLVYFDIYFYLFIYLIWLRRVLVAARGIFIEACGIFRCGAQASLVVACGLLSSCGMKAQ